MADVEEVKAELAKCQKDFKTQKRKFDKRLTELMNKIEELEINSVIHSTVTCDSCKTVPVQGRRWKCCECDNYDLCHTCYQGEKHDLSHAFLRIDKPGDEGEKVAPRAGADDEDEEDSDEDDSDDDSDEEKAPKKTTKKEEAPVKVEPPKPKVVDELEGFNEFEKVNLRLHNQYRAKHQAPPLKLSRKLCSVAQEWALHLCRVGSLQHRQNSPYGENCFGGRGPFKVGDTDATKMWYDEVKYYPYGNAGFSGKTGHFTQVVWKDTKEMGIAIARQQGGVFVVANYSPPGNYAGRFGTNVLRPK